MFPAPGDTACDPEARATPHSCLGAKPLAVLPGWGAGVVFGAAGTTGARRPPSAAHALRKQWQRVAESDSCPRSSRFRRWGLPSKIGGWLRGEGQTGLSKSEEPEASPRPVGLVSHKHSAHKAAGVAFVPGVRSVQAGAAFSDGSKLLDRRVTTAAVPSPLSATAPGS